MPKLEGLQYIVDGKGRKKSVIMSYKAYLQLMEDFDDLRVSRQRSGEPTVDFETVIQELRDAGSL